MSTKYERQSAAHAALAMAQESLRKTTHAMLRGIAGRTCPTPSESWDWKDHAAAWSGEISSAVAEIEDRRVRQAVAKQAMSLGLLTGYDAPRLFTQGIDALRVGE